MTDEQQVYQTHNFWRVNHSPVAVTNKNSSSTAHLKSETEWTLPIKCYFINLDVSTWLSGNNST